MLGQQPKRNLKRVSHGQTVIWDDHKIMFDGITAEQYNQQVARLEIDLNPEPDRQRLLMWCETHLARTGVMTLVLVQLVEDQL